MITYLLGTGASIEPKFIGDVSGDCRVDLVDLSTMISYLTGPWVNLKAVCQ